LEEHHQASNGSPLEHRPSLEKRDELRGLKTSGPVDVLGEALGRDLLLKDRVGFDLEELDGDDLVGFGAATEVGQSLEGLGVTALAEEPTRAVGDEEAPESETEGRDSLNSKLRRRQLWTRTRNFATHGKSPRDRAGVTDEVGAEASPVANHDTCRT